MLSSLNRICRLKGLAPRERVELIIENCAHPMYREQLRAYYEEAKIRGGQTPHILEKAFLGIRTMLKMEQCLKR